VIGDISAAVGTIEGDAQLFEAGVAQQQVLHMPAFAQGVDMGVAAEEQMVFGFGGLVGLGRSRGRVVTGGLGLEVALHILLL
jgi:hypothetical protein